MKGRTTHTAISSSVPPIFKLQGAVQHYAWGGTEFIPRLLGVENTGGRPFAELWLGAHPKAPSTALIDGGRRLDELLSAAPQLLGEAVAEKFGRLPFLLKVLDARDMLSIQVHPSKQQAVEGFARENDAGTPLDSPLRNYQDDNHKPEMHVPLTDFWMLHGFLPAPELAARLDAAPEWTPLREAFAGGGVEGLYRTVMTMPQARIDALLTPLLDRLRQMPSQDPDSPDHWALRAAQTFPMPDGSIDRGILSIYFFNLLHLRPGEGTFQAAGVPHAYLQGSTVELMAASDNVLRGGLTPKAVDVHELLKTVVYASGKPQLLHSVALSPVEQVFPTPASDFMMSTLQLPAGLDFRRNSRAPSIFLAIEGSATVFAGAAQVKISRGEACFVAADIETTLVSADGAHLFCAGVPFEKSLSSGCY